MERIGRTLFGSKPDRMIKPVSAVVDGQENIWILNQGSGRLIRMPLSGKGAEKEFDYGNAGFPSLVSACYAEGFGILFTDSYLNRVFVVEKNAGEATQFAFGYPFDQPTGIAYSRATDRIWVLETGKHQVSIFSASGEFIRSIGNRGSADGEFNFPTHLCIGPGGKVYIVDAMNFRVQVFTERGEFIYSFGEAGDASGSMARPKGIAVDREGTIYLADALFHTVQLFDQEGRFLYYFGNQGRGEGQFWMPAGLFIDENGYIYVADSFNNRIQVFRLTGNE
jgi:DNA-binding beta-propeller fold protein YncE